MKRRQSAVAVVCGVSYVSLVLTHFHLLAEARAALQDAASDKLPAFWAQKVEELSECPFCVSWYVALIVTRGRPIKALQLAGLAMLPTSAALAVTGG